MLFRSCTYVHQLSGIGPETGGPSKIRIFPNPAREGIRIDTRIAGPLSYIITDIAGKPVQSGQVTGSWIETTTLRPGMYLLDFYRYGNQLSERKTLVVR